MAVAREQGGEDRSTPALAELSRIALRAQPLGAALNRIAELARTAVPQSAAVSVTLVDGGKVRSCGVTGPLAAALDERQYEAGFGPCLEAAVTGAPVLIEDTAEETAHRDFAALARRQGVTSVLSVGLPGDDRVTGSLNIYRTAGTPFDDATIRLAEQFAGYAAIAARNAADFAGTSDLVGHLRVALQSRAVIEQAKGVLMERHRCTADEAFHLLVAESQRRHRKLRELATELVASVQPPSERTTGAGPGTADPKS
jgi:GAF domain-containing protein